MPLFKLLGILDIFAVIGYALLLTVEKSAVKYLACYLIAIPIYCGPGLNEICEPSPKQKPIPLQQLT